MSSITTIRDKSGRAVKYRARYRTPDGASRSTTFAKKVDAENHLAAVTVSTASGAFIDVKAGRVTFGAYAQQWADSQPHRASTEVQIESVLRVHVFPVWKNRKLASIRPSEVQAWVSGLELAPSTVAVVYGKVAAIFRCAVDDRLIATSPCTRGIKLPRAEGAEITPMHPEELRAMAEAVSDRYRALIVLLAGSGLRPAEGLGLTVDRVDFLRRTVRVDRQLVTISGRAPVLAPVKTPSSVRTIPVAQAVIDALAAHIEHYSPGPDRLIFTDSKGDPIRRSAIGHIWRRAATKAEVVDRSPHDLRHYAASVMIHQGASVKAVQRQLGHGSATTTLDCYAHLWPDGDEITRKALDAGLAHVVSPTCHAEGKESTA
jgi:integrase